MEGGREGDKREKENKRVEKEKRTEQPLLN